MTRINVGVNPSELSSKHLIAEHREIKRIPNCISKNRYNMKNQPSKFTLGEGHVKFFYDKLLYLKNRYILLYDECTRRGFNVQNYIDSWNDVPVKLMGNYVETEHDRTLILERIKDNNLKRLIT